MKRFRFIIKRLLSMIVIMFLVSFLVFVVLRMSDADPLTVMIGNNQSTPELRQALTEKYHLDDPVHIQYLRWIKGVLSGDFGTDYVLREYPNHMNVFLYAPLEARIKHMCETYDLSWPEADKLIKRVDRQRHNYYKYVTGKNRGDRDNKHLMIDVSEYGTDLTAEMICFAARKMFED